MSARIDRGQNPTTIQQKSDSDPIGRGVRMDRDRIPIKIQLESDRFTAANWSDCGRIPAKLRPESSRIVAADAATAGGRKLVVFRQ